MLSRIVVALLGAFLLVQAPGAIAQSYPSRPVTLVVPFPAGGSPDILARIVAEKVAADLGSPVVVENRPGAGGSIGAGHVALSKPDGYTLMLATLSHVTSPVLTEGIKWDPAADFVGVVDLFTAPVVALVQASVPARTLQEFVELARKQPGKLNYLMPGTGTSMHLNTEMLRKTAGIDVVPVPYKGIPSGMPDLLTGRLSFAMSPMSVALPHIDSGALRPLAVASPRRIKDLPDTPTFIEAGFPEAQVVSWYAIIAPAATPDSVRERINVAFTAALADPVVRERIAKAGALVSEPSKPEQVDAMLKSESRKWAQLLKEMNIKN